MFSSFRTPTSQLTDPLLERGRNTDSPLPNTDPRTPDTVPRRLDFNLDDFASPAALPIPMVSPIMDVNIEFKIINHRIESAIIQAVNQFETRHPGELNNIHDDTIRHNFFLSLRKNQHLLYLFRVWAPTLDENQRDNIILQILDQIILHREGCSIIQTEKNKNQLEELIKANEEESWMKIMSEARRSRSKEIEKLEQLIRDNQLKQKRIIIEGSFSAIQLSYKNRECSIIKSLRDTFPGQNSFCGTATSPVTSSGIISQGVAELPARNFTLSISGTGDVCSDTTFRLIFNHDELNESNLINALLKRLSIPGTNTNGTIVTSLYQQSMSCSSCPCILMGGVAPIKATAPTQRRTRRRRHTEKRQYKKYKIPRSLFKYNKHRRINKSRKS